MYTSYFIAGFKIYFVIKLTACLNVFWEAASRVHALVLKVIGMQEMGFIFHAKLVVAPNRHRGKVFSFHF